MIKNKFINISKWSESSIEKDKIYNWKTENLNIFIKKEDGNLKISYTREFEFEFDSLTWQEWLIDTSTSSATVKNELKIKISPVFHDKPIVLRFPNSFSVIKKNKKQLYLEFPVWIKIQIKQKEVLYIPIEN